MVQTIVLTALIMGGTSSTAPEPTLHKELEAFRPFLGKTYRGVFKESTPEKPVIDVSTYERAMNGMAIRTLHSINDGEYGGETLIYWDASKKAVAFFYMTTAGFRTEGTLTLVENGYSAIEDVKGNANGITKVRSNAVLKKDGTLHVTSEYFKDDKWTPGRETVYTEDPKAKVIFR